MAHYTEYDQNQPDDGPLPCPACEGQGVFRFSDPSDLYGYGEMPCDKCNGYGYTPPPSEATE